MIKDVKIKNFRCFRNTEFKEFKQVNLIGGKNNSGKTAFLEAVFLNTSPKARSIELLRRFRQIDSSFIKEMPERAWSNLFLDNDNREAEIGISTDSQDNYTLRVTCDEPFEDFIKILSDDKKDKEFEEEGSKFQEPRELLSNRESTRSSLHLNYSINGKEDITATLIAHSEGVLVKEANGPDVKDIFFIPSSLKMSSQSLAEEFDQADLNGLGERVLEAFQIIDSDISEVKTISVGKPSIYLKTKQNDFLPIGLFGDAINKVSYFILKMINNRNSILLIDEIENGIHYSNQEELWNNIFKVAKEFDVQIFATTHSIEMIKAFAKVVRNYNDNIGSYFELFKHRNTGEITTNIHDINTLFFEIDNNVAIRGE